MEAWGAPCSPAVSEGEVTESQVPEVCWWTCVTGFGSRAASQEPTRWGDPCGPRERLRDWASSSAIWTSQPSVRRSAGLLALQRRLSWVPPETHPGSARLRPPFLAHDRGAPSVYAGSRVSPGRAREARGCPVASSTQEPCLSAARLIGILSWSSVLARLGSPGAPPLPAAQTPASGSLPLTSGSDDKSDVNWCCCCKQSQSPAPPQVCPQSRSCLQLCVQKPRYRQGLPASASRLRSAFLSDTCRSGLARDGESQGAGSPPL